MTLDDLPDLLARYADRGWDLSERWYITFELSWSGGELPPGFRQVLRAVRVSACVTREEQGGRPILVCRLRAVPTAATIRRVWTRIDEAASTFGVPPVESFHLSRV